MKLILKLVVVSFLLSFNSFAEPELSEAIKTESSSAATNVFQSTLSSNPGYIDFLRNVIKACSPLASAGGGYDCFNWMQLNMLAVDLNSVASGYVNVLFSSMSPPNYSGLITFKTMTMVYFPINNSKGFELRAYSDQDLVQILVMDASSPTAKNFRVIYKGNTVATGDLTPCKQNESCAGQTPIVIVK